MEELQILLLLAYLAIGLMAITVPTYAISVSYLARETLKTLEDMRKRRKDLGEKLDELRKKLEREPGIKGIKEEIKKFEEEEAELEDRLECLSAKGAVVYPLGGFMLGLACATYGIYTFPKNFGVFILTSIISIAFGIYRLGKSLFAVEQAALRPEEELLPTFRVSFVSGASIERFKAKEQKEIEFLINNYGKDVAEDVNVMILFPPEFKLLKKRGYVRVEQLLGSRYPGYNAARFTTKVLHVDLSMLYKALVGMPEKTGFYIIPVCVRARKIGKSDHQLTIEVV